MLGTERYLPCRTAKLSRKICIASLSGRRPGNVLLMSPSAPKCFHLGINRKKIPVDFKHFLNGKRISKVPSTIYLGLHITQ